jgi:retinol-binding protein 3
VIRELADRLAAEYAFAEMGAKLAGELRQRLATGAYASAASGVAFARALTTDLQATSKDKHLRIRFEAEAGGPRRGPGGPPAPPAAGPGPRRPPPAGGITKLEVLEGRVGYLHMRGVPPLEVAENAVAAAFAFLKNTDALILDCRNNDGGDPRTVALYVSYLSEGSPFVINTFHPRNGKIQEFATTELGELSYGEQKPVFVLTSPRTFSGGEELAYDLQALQRAVLVGEVTGGGANPAQGVLIAGHFLARIPFAHPVNPITNANWEGSGVQPDIAVPEDRALSVALDAIRARLQGSSPAPAPKHALPARQPPKRASVASAGPGNARGPNLLTNGDFSKGQAPWGVASLGPGGPQKHPSRLSDGALCVKIRGGEQLFVGWPDAEHPTPLAIRAGTTYQLSFRASASGRWPLRASIRVGHQTPPYTPIVQTEVPLDVRPLAFHVDVESEQGDDLAGVAFQVRAAPGRGESEVCLDDVALRAVPKAPHLPR